MTFMAGALLIYGGIKAISYFCLAAKIHQQDLPIYRLLKLEGIRESDHFEGNLGLFRCQSFVGKSRPTCLFYSHDRGGSREEFGQVARNQSSELIIHDPNGQIRERNSYGSDLYPQRD